MIQKMKNALRTITTPIVQSHWIADLMVAIPRIVGGYFLAVNFGGSKFGMPWTNSGQGLSLFQVAEWFPKDVAEFGGLFAIAPVFFAWMAAASEAIGGFFLVLGFQTRISSALLACTMMVAIFFQKWNDGLWSMLPAMGFLWLAIYGMVLGSGRFGLDHLMTRKAKATKTIANPNVRVQSA